MFYIGLPPEIVLDFYKQSCSRKIKQTIHNLEKEITVNDDLSQEKVSTYRFQVFR